MTISAFSSFGKMRTAMATFMAKNGQVPQRWFLVDATDQVVGRLAVQIATVLRGKHRPEYTPHTDTGEFVIVINAEKVRFTGKKWDSQTYQSYSHYPGGLKQVTARQVLAKHPERILLEAVKRMVPRNRLGRQQMTKLKIYAGPSHPHQAQQPQEFKPHS
jgi:large subunit ribosomal protein L13